MIKPRFVIPNAFTSLNFLLGVWAICFAAGAFTTGSAPDPLRPFAMASHFVIFCALLDKLDGFAARIMNASSEFGAQFDSLADLIAFGIAPGLTLFFAYKNLAPAWFDTHTPFLVVTLSIYVLCAAMRLAKYNAMDSDSYPDYFVGMPTTFAGSINAVTIILLGQYGFWQNPNNPYIHLPLLLMVGTAILMVSPLFLPKVKKRKSKFLNMLQAVSILVTYIVGFAMVYTEYLLVNLVLYFVLGFGFGLFNRDKIIAEQEASSVEASA